MNPSFDLERVRQLAQGDSAFVEDIVGTFLEHIPNQLQALTASYQKEQWEDLGRAAHTLKSSVDLFGIAAIYEDIRWLEAMGKQGVEQPECKATIQRVQQTLFQVLDQLKAGVR
jgi:HPt (histidine-containing phosphotransfer) domain-containing protein